MDPAGGPIIGGPSGTLFGRGFCGLAALGQLNDGHRRGIAQAETKLHDPRVATRSTCESWAQIIEQLDHHLTIAQPRKHEAAIGQRGGLAQGDNGLNDSAQLLGFGQSGLDLLMAQERIAEVTQQRLAMRAGAIEFSESVAMAHDCGPVGACLQVADELSGALETGRWPVFELHPKSQPA